MKTIIALSLLSVTTAFGDTVEFNRADDGSATLVVTGKEAEKLFAAMKNVKREVRTSPYPGYGSATIKPFSGVECTTHAADRLPNLYTCTVKFYNVENGIPDSR